MKRRGLTVFLILAMMMNVLLPWGFINEIHAEEQNREIETEAVESDPSTAEEPSVKTEAKAEKADLITAKEPSGEAAMEAEEGADFAEFSAVYVFQAIQADDREDQGATMLFDQETQLSESAEAVDEFSECELLDAESDEGLFAAEQPEEESEENPQDKQSNGEPDEECSEVYQQEEESEANPEDALLGEETIEDGPATEQSEGGPEANSEDELLNGRTDDSDPEIEEPENPERELSATQEGNDASPEGTSESMDFQISGLTLIPVGTNEKYSTLSFSFTSGESEYSCLVTGLGDMKPAETADTLDEEESKKSETFGAYGEEAFAGSALFESCERLAEAIASSFLSCEVFTLSDQTAPDQFGLSLDMIDAEKTSKSGSDRNICWAASASDMLEFAGWNVSADGEDAADEDTAFQEFRESFSDLGGYQTSGISWYLDGVNPEQYTYAASGKIAYMERTDGAAQQLQAGTGGHWTEYAAAEVAPENGYYDGIETLLEDAADRLEDGYAVGLGTYNYSGSGAAVSGHAMTVFGFVREWLDQAASVLRALFVADSDDRATGSITSTAPEDRPDEYVMYALAPYESDSVSSIRLENYPGSYSTVIGMVSTLQPQASVGPETNGTKDAVHSPNLVPSELRIADEDGVFLTEAEAGATVTVETDFENRAYQGLPEGATIQYEVIVYRDGELVNRTEQTMTADGLRPNHSVSGSLQITLDQPGEYTFETRALQILSSDGEPIPEAYLNDNTYLGVPRKLTVPDNSERNPAGEENPEQASAAETNAISQGQTEPETSGEKIWHLTVVLATDTEYALYFNVESSSQDSFLQILNQSPEDAENQNGKALCLRNRDTGKIVDPANYEIFPDGEGFRIMFTESYICTLRPGRNDFVLTWEGGRVLIQITLR